MRLDLGRVSVEFEAEFFDEVAAELLPVESGKGREMGVIVSNGPIDLAGERNAGQASALFAQAVNEIRHFLAQRAGSRRLSVGARLHGQRGRRMGKRRQSFYQRID